MRLRIALIGAAAAIAAFIVLVAMYDRATIPSSTMAPDVPAGTTALVDTVDRGSDLARGDIVIVDPSEWDPTFTTPFTLRVIGLPGDSIAADGNALTVNGTTLDEPYASGDTGAITELTVPEGRMFLLADRRDNGRDSRQYLDIESGTLPFDAVEYRVHAVAWPIGGLGTVPVGGGTDWLPPALTVTLLLGISMVSVAGAQALRGLRRSKTETQRW